MPKPNPADYPPPEGLSERSTALWASIVPRRATSAGRLALIEEALRALDRADQARRIVDEKGPTFETETTGTVHVRPETRIERENRQMFARIWSSMHLEWSYNEDGLTH